MTPPRFVIVGASLAGAKAAETLRHEGFDGEVVLVGEEPVRPYERPPLSKGYLQGSTARETVFVHDAGFYGANGIDLRLSRRVETVDPKDRRVVARQWRADRLRFLPDNHRCDPPATQYHRVGSGWGVLPAGPG